MNQLISQEPPDGDFAAYIEAIVGPPPEDPENAARDISEQLALRSKDNIEIMNAISPSHNQSGRDSSDSTFVRRGPLSTGGALSTAKTTVAGRADLQGLPDLAESLQQVANRGVSGFRRLVSKLARFMMFAGGAWLFASIALTDQFPGLTSVPGFAVLFVGIVLSNLANGSRKR